MDIQDIDVMQKVVRREGFKIAILAIPAEEAQTVADQMIESGIKAILNYAPITLTVPHGIRVEYLDPVIQLQRMTYYI